MLVLLFLFNPVARSLRALQQASLWTGHKPTLRTYEMICYNFTGMAEEDELLAYLADKLQPHAA